MAVTGRSPRHPKEGAGHSQVETASSLFSNRGSEPPAEAVYPSLFPGLVAGKLGIGGYLLQAARKVTPVLYEGDLCFSQDAGGTVPGD